MLSPMPPPPPLISVFLDETALASNQTPAVVNRVLDCTQRDSTIIVYYVLLTDKKKLGKQHSFDLSLTRNKLSEDATKLGVVCPSTVVYLVKKLRVPVARTKRREKNTTRLNKLRLSIYQRPTKRVCLVNDRYQIRASNWGPEVMKDGSLQVTSLVSPLMYSGQPNTLSASLHTPDIVLGVTNNTRALRTFQLILKAMNLINPSPRCPILYKFCSQSQLFGPNFTLSRE